jgi:hypothetical protein
MALALVVLWPAVVLASPKVLTDAQMDGVTAGAIRVDAVAFAQALGDIALTRTRTHTLTGPLHRRFEFGVAFAEGVAFACCSRTSEVVVASGTSSTGHVVYSKDYTYEFRGAIAGRRGQVRYFAYGYSASFLVALDFGDHPGFQTVGKRRHGLGRSIGRLIDLSRVWVRNGIVSSFEFAPVFAAGLRWHVLRDLSATARYGPLVKGVRSSPAHFRGSRGHR